MLFKNRKEAGSLLANLLIEKNVIADIILTIPRGGIPVAMEIAKQMELPMRLYFIRKLGHPIDGEFAIGAVSVKGMLINNKDFGWEKSPDFTILVQKERKRINEMIEKFNHVINPAEIRNKHTILVDDGIATGSCMELAIQELRENGAAMITVATPVCAKNTYAKINKLADDFITCMVPEHFIGIGAYYKDFEQVTDDEVIAILSKNSS
ncbi:MAG: hypothetical protein RLZZ595_2035 [Bacteroidota bacterium]|jgi:predicted phosphoribosyltransferase